ncbi:Phosphotyrosyl phosphatase activator [Lichtheimia hyalospora FSU 10163]|nr:Phosphotyrosyl phosphatase activator [Lichtheimia hyalospora FSU 10163]
MNSVKEHLPNLSSTYTPTIPTKCIHTQVDIDRFIKTKAFSRLLTFVILLNASVTQKPNSYACHVSEQTQRVLDMLNTLDSWLAEFPPLDNPQRFGNKAFRQWLNKLESNVDTLLKSTLPSALHVAIPELSIYLIGSFGNGTRIDYGSGHELNFLAWLGGIAMLGGFTEQDYEAVVLKIFVQYLELARKIQRTYTLEPAGSHGVWGLDDHQFLPYIWGSAQMLDHPRLKPKSILNKDTIEAMANENMYFRCIQYIHQVKRGPFHEHSPMLFDISAVLTWNKVNTGMVKMYIAEVLKKVPVVQHFLFGHLFPFEPLEDQ